MEWKTWLALRAGMKYAIIAVALQRIGAFALAASISERAGGQGRRPPPVSWVS